MPSDKRLEGRLAALKLARAIVPAPSATEQKVEVSLDGLRPALEAIAESQADFSPLVDALGALAPWDGTDAARLIAQAVAGLKLQAGDVAVNISLDKLVAAVQQIDFSALENRIKSVTSAINDNTNAIRELVAVARKTKVVKYDEMGRIAEIAISKAGK